MSILKGRHQLQYGTTTIEYELMYSKRKTLAIHVYPDGSVVVDAPFETDLKAVETKILKRAAWILRQKQQFQSYAVARALPRRYVSGESFAYLGRHYRLKLVENPVRHVVLSRGYLTVGVPDTQDKAQVSELVDRWYRSHAKRIFAERLAIIYPRVEFLGVPYPALSIRAMKSRWGSCTSAGNILLNINLIQVPKPLIDYVLIHELCHLKEHNHSYAFYALLDRAQPNWREVRQRLNQMEII